jgi:Icc-related predicted phosphoesterase
VVMVGHGGWGDGLAGLGAATSRTMNDSWLIKDLARPKAELFRELQRLGEVSAEYMARILPVAARQAKRVIVATHVPPFPEVCRHEDKPTTDQYLPHYVNQALGEALDRVVDEFPAVQFQVLCGHTHERCRAQVRPNLAVWVAAAEPCHPQIEAVLEF